MQAVSLHMLSNGKYSVIKVSNCSKRFVRTAATVLIRRAELGSFPDTDNRGTEPNSNWLHNSLCSYCRLVDKHSNQHASCSCACWFADDHQFQHVSLVCCGWRHWLAWTCDLMDHHLYANRECEIFVQVPEEASWYSSITSWLGWECTLLVFGWPIFRKNGCCHEWNHCKLLSLYELAMFLSQINVFRERGSADSHELSLFLQLYGGNLWVRKTGMTSVASYVYYNKQVLESMHIATIPSFNVNYFKAIFACWYWMYVSCIRVDWWEMVAHQWLLATSRI